MVQYELLGSPDVPVRVKRELARHDHLRDKVQLRYGEDAEALATYERMLIDDDPMVRRDALVSTRFRPPARLIPRLLADEAAPERWSAPDNRCQAIERIPLTRELARSLVADADPRVRRAVAANPDLPRDLLDVLAADRDSEVRRVLIYRPHIPLDVLDSIDYEVHPRARMYPVTWLWERRHDQALVAEYARSCQVVYRRAVARMPGLAAEVVERLAADDDFAVRLILAESNGTQVPVWVLVEMLLTWEGFSRFNLARNPRVPDDFIDRLSRSEQAEHRWLAHYSG